MAIFFIVLMLFFSLFLSSKVLKLKTFLLLSVFSMALSLIIHIIYYFMFNDAVKAEIKMWAIISVPLLCLLNYLFFLFTYLIFILIKKYICKK